jgi:hypothetical protein
MRIPGIVLLEEHEKWDAGNRCFDMTEYHEHMSRVILDSASDTDGKEAA